MGGFAIKSAIDFKSAFVGVRKTVNAIETGFRKLEEGIRKMSTETPASAVEIAGVHPVMIDLGERTNMSATEAAKQLARLANITGMSQNGFDRLGSAIVDLGNNMETIESEIVSMGMRITAAGIPV